MQEPISFTQMGFLLNAKQFPWYSLTKTFRNEHGHYGPDEFFILKKCMEKNIPTLGVKEILAWLRQSHFDANIFGRTADRLADLVNDRKCYQNTDVARTLFQVWQHHFQLGSGVDIAGLIAMVLHQMCYHDNALEFLDYSKADFGDNCFNAYLEMCVLVDLKMWDKAKVACQVVLGLDGNYRGIRHFRRKLRC